MRIQPAWNYVGVIILGLAITLCDASAQDKSRGDSVSRKQKADEIKKRVQRQIDQIKRADQDQDGKIAKSEASDRLKRNFDRIDRNRDGFVDSSELEQLAKTLIQNQQRQNRPRRQDGRNVPVPADVELIKDISYRESTGEDKVKENNAADQAGADSSKSQRPDYWKLDLVQPKKKSESPRPAIVFVHGGGWRGGDKGGGIWRQYPIHFAKRGYVCISINYRLSQVAAFPACVEDCKCAVRWLRANAKKYNVDPNRIGAFGNSAGAHLVSMLGLVGKDANLEGDGPHQKYSSSVQAVCPSATPADFTVWAKQNLGNQDRLLAGSSSGLDARAKRASPVSYANENAPPFLIFHGTDDRTVPIDQGNRLAEALKKSGAKHVTYKVYEGAGHGVFRQNQSETLPMLEKFFDKHLKK